MYAPATVGFLGISVNTPSVSVSVGIGPSVGWVPLGWGELEAFVTYTYVGDHTQDQSGLQQLGTYNTWDFGITAYVGDNWQFVLRGTNVTDELGLTESNSRIFGVAADEGGVLLARPLEGSEINFQAKYLFE